MSRLRSANCLFKIFSYNLPAPTAPPAFCNIHKSKIFIPALSISHHPKRKAANKRLNSRFLLTASQCAPLSSVYVKQHFSSANIKERRGVLAPGLAGGQARQAGQEQGGAGWPLGEPDASLEGRLHLAFAMPLPLPYPCFNGH